MDRDGILDAIRRCADANGGVPLGRKRFEQETGIRESQWSGRYWLRWSDAVAEAGLVVASMNAAHPDGVIFDALAELVRSLGHYPIRAELKMHRRENPTFPSPNVFDRFGGKADVAARLVAHCGDDPTMADVVAIAAPIAADAVPSEDEVGTAYQGPPLAGEVYLMKSGDYYKVGRSNATGRREYEVRLQLPEPVEVVHVIETDDAVGIERYWHERFADRRANGEWFRLSKADVAAFRRRKRFM